MKKYLLALLMLASTANAQSIDCPKKLGIYWLTDASTYFDKKSEIQGERKELKNGYDEILPPNVEYLVCEYENAQKKWRRFQPKDGINSCALQLRRIANKVERISLICK